jgi:hypothetical protein
MPPVHTICRLYSFTACGNLECSRVYDRWRDNINICSTRVAYCALLLVFAVIVIRGLINGTNTYVEPFKGVESSSRLHVRLGQRSFFSELGGVRSTALSATQSFSEVTVRNVFEASCPGPLAQKTVALFVTPSTHNRMFMLALLNHDVVPSWHSPTSTKSFSRTTDLNL